MGRYVYPFTAIVGQEELKKALILNVIDPSIGGVLLRGEKGTGKSLAVRALAEILPETEVIKGCPFSCRPGGELCYLCREKVERGEELEVVRKRVEVVELPLGATEDRVVGTIDIEAALKRGEKKFEPGVLAKANGNILYVDEVNLLEDHLVDLLLDAAAMGVNYVEREGISFSHPSRFVLVGTMNPEEGELRPQLLDRFGLSVEVKGLRDVEERKEVVRRRVEFEKDPEGFCKRWEEKQKELRERIEKARKLLPHVSVSDGILDLISRLCLEFGVDGHRADITLYKASSALAAFKGKDEVDEEDVEEVAGLVLLHRRRRKPFEDPESGPENIKEILGRLKGGEDKTFDSGEPYRVNPIEPRVDRTREFSGKRMRLRSRDRGRYVRSVPAGKNPKSIAVDATLRRAALRGKIPILISPQDLMEKVRERKVGSLIVFLIDASGSMVAEMRMREAKRAVLSLLVDAYKRRDRVGMVVFRGRDAQVVLPPTGSPEFAKKCLDGIPTGGKTPLAKGLLKTLELLEGEVRKGFSPLLVLITDGRANVGIWGDPLGDAIRVAREIGRKGVKSLVLDVDDDFVPLGVGERIAREIGGIYMKVRELNADVVTRVVRGRIC